MARHLPFRNPCSSDRSKTAFGIAVRSQSLATKSVENRRIVASISLRNVDDRCRLPAEMAASIRAIAVSTWPTAGQVADHGSATRGTPAPDYRYQNTSPLFDCLERSSMAMRLRSIGVGREAVQHGPVNMTVAHGRQNGRTGVRLQRQRRLCVSLINCRRSTAAGGPTNLMRFSVPRMYLEARPNSRTSRHQNNGPSTIGKWIFSLLHSVPRSERKRGSPWTLR